MTQPPRRLRPDNSERVSVVVNRVASGSASGSTRYARPVPGPSSAALNSIPPLNGVGPFVPLGYSGIATGVLPADAVPAGSDARTDGVRSAAIGWESYALGDYSASLGPGTRAGGQASVCIGYGTGADADFSTALGPGAVVDTPCTGSVAIGQDANCFYPYEIVMGRGHTVTFTNALETTAGAASGKYLRIRSADDDTEYLIPLYNLP